MDQCNILTYNKISSIENILHLSTTKLVITATNFNIIDNEISTNYDVFCSYLISRRTFFTCLNNPTTTKTHSARSFSTYLKLRSLPFMHIDFCKKEFKMFVAFITKCVDLV